MHWTTFSVLCPHPVSVHCNCNVGRVFLFCPV